MYKNQVIKNLPQHYNYSSSSTISINFIEKVIVDFKIYRIRGNYRKILILKISKILSYFKTKLFKYFQEMALLKHGFVLKS